MDEIKHLLFPDGAILDEVKVSKQYYLIYLSIFLYKNCVYNYMLCYYIRIVKLNLNIMWN